MPNSYTCKCCLFRIVYVRAIAIKLGFSQSIVRISNSCLNDLLALTWTTHCSYLMYTNLNTSLSFLLSFILHKHHLFIYKCNQNVPNICTCILSFKTSIKYPTLMQDIFGNKVESNQYAYTNNLISLQYIALN